MWLLVLLLCEYKPQTLAVPPFEHTFGFYRASKYYLQLFLGPGFNYNDPQGITAVKLKELDNPKTKKDDDELTAYAVNSGNGQIIYNIGLEAVKIYGNKETFSNPKGITANSDGLVAVADFGNRRVVKLQYQKGDLKWAGEIPLAGRPFDVCFDSQNNLYVTDYDNSRICVYGPDNNLITSFGRTGRALGEIYQPMGIEVIDAQGPHNRYQDDFIVITDDDGKRVSKFTSNGQFLGSVYDFELGLADAHFLYVAMDYYASIYVTDDVNNQIHKFDHDLRYIISEGRTGTDQGEFAAPRGITINRRYGQVFITEKEGGQYLWIAGDVIFVGAFPPVVTPALSGTTIAIYLTQEVKVNMAIYNAMNEKVKDLLKDLKCAPGEFLVVWDGLDSKNALVPEGVYQIKIDIKPLHGHGARIKRSVQGSVTFRSL
jgi:DNA-binding beta-propeller fold protein YncE